MLNNKRELVASITLEEANKRQDLLQQFLGVTETTMMQSVGPPSTHIGVNTLVGVLLNLWGPQSVHTLTSLEPNGHKTPVPIT